MEGFEEEEVKKLLKAFNELGVKPKADTPTELMHWMQGVVGATATVEVEGAPASAPGTSTTTGTTKQFVHQQPRLPTFSGDGKGDVTFELWKYEVKCLVKEKHSGDFIMQSIRRSLRGEAGRVAMRLGPDTSISNLLANMESVYGEVDQNELLLAKFYSAKQQDTEDVSHWGCRLEDLLAKAVEMKTVPASESASMLRIMFWSGLKSELKDITAHLYERIMDFDQLRVAVRRVEQDHKLRTESVQPKKTAHCKVATTEEGGQLDEIKGMIQQLSTEMKTLKSDQEIIHSQMGTYGWTDGNSGGQRNRQQKQYSQYRGRGGNRQNKPYQFRNDKQERDKAQREPGPPAEAENQSDDEEVICWNCGQPGHIARGCRVRGDHRRRGLNSGRPMSRGRH